MNSHKLIKELERELGRDYDIRDWFGGIDVLVKRDGVLQEVFYVVQPHLLEPKILINEGGSLHKATGVHYLDYASARRKTAYVFISNGFNVINSAQFL